MWVCDLVMSRSFLIENGKLTIDNFMENIIEEKSFRFAVRIVNLNKYLRFEKTETVLSKQLLRSGTSVGANVAEAQQAQSRADFVSKLGIALKEATETKYWLRLLKETDYLSDTQFESVFKDCVEVERILISIVKSSK
jgi:four helix bundle protein